MEALESLELVNLRPKASIDNPISDHINPCFYQESTIQPVANMSHIMLIKKRANKDTYILETRLKRLYEEDLKASRQIEKIKADRQRLEAQRFYRYKVDSNKLEKKLKDKEAVETLKQKNMYDKLLTTEKIRTSRSESILRKSENAMQMKLDYLYNKQCMKSEKFTNEQYSDTCRPYTYNFTVPLIYQRNKIESQEVLQQNQQVDQLLHKIKMYKGIEDELSKKLNITQEERQKELERFQDLSFNQSHHIRSSSQLPRALKMPNVFKRN